MPADITYTSIYDLCEEARHQGKHLQNVYTSCILSPEALIGEVALSFNMSAVLSHDNGLAKCWEMVDPPKKGT